MPILPCVLISIFQFTSPGPIFIDLGLLKVRWYGLLIACALVLGANLSQKLANYRKINSELIANLVIWLVLAAIPSARLYYVLFEWQIFIHHPERILQIWQGGIAIHGAILGGLISSLIFARLKQVSFWQLADIVAPSLILGQAIGRWGNFFNSEAFGRPTNLPWKLYISPEHRPAGYESFDYFHPTFLYESLWDLAIFGLLMALFFRVFQSKPKLKVGTVFLTYLVGYSLGRLWIEGLRMDSLMLGSLRIAQIISFIGVFLGLIGLYRLHIQGRSLPDVIA